MFYKKTVNRDYADTTDFGSSGFYWIKAKTDESLHYYNNGFWLILEHVNNVPLNILDLFQETDVIANKSSEKESAQKDKLEISENFILKLVAVSKVNSQSIKMSDIIDKK